MAYNAKQDKDCLEEVAYLIELFNTTKKRPVAAIVVEPVQSEGGDNFGSAFFFQNLQRISKEVRASDLFFFQVILVNFFIVVEKCVYN